MFGGAITPGTFCSLAALSLLWWHPAAWMIYARIRRERECSSDEMAVRLTGSAAPLARALYRLADWSATTDPVLIGARSSGLTDRIARLTAPKQQVRGRALPLVGGATIALIAAAVAGSSAGSRREALTRAYAASAVAPPTIFTFHAHDPAGTFLVRMVRGRVTSIDLGPDPVPPGRIVQSGDTVQVLGEGGRELLRIEVDPRGALRWNARRAS